MLKNSLWGSADNRVVDNQHDDRADNGDDYAGDIETGDATVAQGGKQEATDESADDPKDDIQDHTLTGLIDNPARDVTRDEAEDQPRYNSHEVLSLRIGGGSEPLFVGRGKVGATLACPVDVAKG
jgi:hypothetical protein